MGSPDDPIETVPITDQVAEKVKEAVDEVEREQPPDSGARPRDLPAVELGEAAPASIGEVMPMPSESLLAIRRALRGATKALLVAAFLAAIAAAFLAFTETGRAWLPRSMRGDAKKIARQLEQRVHGPEQSLYTFTDSDGVVHIVDRWEKVPKEYRKRAKKAR